MDYAELYYEARARYNNATYEIYACKNKLESLKNQKQKIINKIYQLKAEKKKSEKAAEQLQRISNAENGLTGKLRTIKNKIDNAAINYSKMASASEVTNKNLSEVYEEEGRQNANTIENVMSTVRTDLEKLIQLVDELKKELQNLENELNSITQSIRNTEVSLSEWKRIKNNAAYEMTYYHRRLQMEG